MHEKAEYVNDIAEAAISGTVDFDSLNSLSDIDIVKRISSLRGVGAWTAEMILIFHSAVLMC